MVKYYPPVRRGLDPIGANLSCLASSSCAGLTRASILFARKFLRRSMDCRVKPGNDDLKLARMGLDPRIHLLREKVLTKIDGLQRTSGLPQVRTIIRCLNAGNTDLRGP